MELLNQSELGSNLRDSAIEARIVIVVTGHRLLNNQLLLAEAIQSMINRIREMAPPLRNTPLILHVLSPLAEGADRLVAREILKVPGAVLEAILPLEKEDYIKDFSTNESRGEFEELLAQANSVRILPFKFNRARAYQQTGHYVVDQCDVLIAIWDGKPSAGLGGTEEIVTYARKNERPIVWIHSDDPSQVTVESSHGLAVKRFTDLDEYNSERINVTKFKRQFEGKRQFFLGIIQNIQVPFDRIQSTLEYFLR